MSKHYGRVSLYALLEPEEGGRLLCLWPPLLYNLRSFTAPSKCYPNPGIEIVIANPALRDEAIPALFNEIATHLLGARKDRLEKRFYSLNWDSGANVAIS
jgi:hypothetical protein